MIKVSTNLKCMAIIMLLFIIVSMLWHFGLKPTVFPDEWLYSSSSRLQPLKESIFPSYLYLFIFKSANQIGSRFLEYTRVLNSIFYVLTFPGIYFLARKLSSEKTALYVATASLFFPMNSYNAYFMPESLYFLAFWVFTYFVINHAKMNWLIYATICGFIIALMCLIKMHGAFMIPVMVLFMFFQFIKREMNPKQFLFNSILIFTTFLLCRCIVGFLLAGEPGLNISGAKYANNYINLFDLTRLKTILTHLYTPLIGHLLGLSILFSIPILILFKNLISNNNASSTQRILCYFTASCLVTLVLITAFFTTQVTNWHSYESLNRLHLRYYSFIFPLFLILTLTEINAIKGKTTQLTKYAVYILVVLNILAAIFLQKNYMVSFIDSPELFGLMFNHTMFILAIFLSSLCLLVYLYANKYGAKLYLFLFIPFLLFTANYHVNQEVQAERFYYSDNYDRAGEFIQTQANHISPQELALVGPDKVALTKILFYLDQPKVTISEMQENLPLEFAKISPRIKWILFVGNYPVLTKHKQIISGTGFSLINIES